MTQMQTQAQPESRLEKMLKPRNAVLLILLLILAVAVYMFAAANVVPESGAGDGTGTVSGYTISSVHWNPDAADPDEVDSVVFDIVPTGGAGAPDEVYVTVDGGTTWISCGAPVGTTSTCTFGAGVLTSGITTLQVTAYEAP
jgi:hypothetical protein